MHTTTELTVHLALPTVHIVERYFLCSKLNDPP